MLYYIVLCWFFNNQPSFFFQTKHGSYGSYGSYGGATGELQPGDLRRLGKERRRKGCDLTEMPGKFVPVLNVYYRGGSPKPWENHGKTMGTSKHGMVFVRENPMNVEDDWGLLKPMNSYQ